MRESLEEHLQHMEHTCEQAREEDEIPEWFISYQESLIDKMWEVA